MSRAIRTIGNAVVVVIGMCLCEIANGQLPGVTITNSLSASGTTLLRLSGPIADGCTIFDQTTQVVASNNISIDTLYYHNLPCFAVPPPGFVNIVVDVGILPAGVYNVTWTLVPPPGGAVPTVISAQLSLFSAIPTLGPHTLLLSIFAVAVIGAFALRRGIARGGEKT